MPAAAVDAKDRRLGAMIVKAGLATQEQVDECAAIRAKLVAAGAAARSLGDILLQKGHVTKDGAVEIAKMATDVKAAEFAAAGETKRRVKSDDASTGADAAGGANGMGKLKIPGYEILELLGKGGMGSVYKARQKSLDRIVALKVLSPDIAKDKMYLKRFETEARAIARLNHENIIAGIDVGEANGYRYFAMEYVEGESLAALIERDGALAEKRALTIVMQVARALVHADKNDLVHRDVKPQNIMIGRNDVAKLCDLGLAMTAEERKEARERGQSIGTPHYISPEQARGEHHVDIRSDIYSLGATLYHAVTGETPFAGTSPMVLMTKHLTEEPVPPRKKNPKLSKPASDLVLRMMAKEKEKRYQTPIELLEDMERVLAGRGIGGGASSGRRAAPGKDERPASRGAKGKAGARADSGPRGAAAKRPGKPAARPGRGARIDDEGLVDDADLDAQLLPDDEEAEEEPRFKKPKKMPGNVMALISVFVLLIVGGIAALIFAAANDRAPVGPAPASAEAEENGRQSLSNIRAAFAAKNIDKFGAIAKLRELQALFDRTQAAADAEAEINRLNKLPLDGQSDAPADDDAPLPPPKRAPLGAKQPDADGGK